MKTVDHGKIGIKFVIPPIDIDSDMYLPIPLSYIDDKNTRKNTGTLVVKATSEEGTVSKVPIDVPFNNLAIEENNRVVLLPGRQIRIETLDIRLDPGATLDVSNIEQFWSTATYVRKINFMMSYNSSIEIGDVKTFDLFDNVVVIGKYEKHLTSRVVFLENTTFGFSKRDRVVVTDSAVFYNGLPLQFKNKDKEKVKKYFEMGISKYDGANDDINDIIQSTIYDGTLEALKYKATINKAIDKWYGHKQLE